MREYTKFYINGQWVDPSKLQPLDVINPATEAVCARIALGQEADVNSAVEAARAAFASYGYSSRQERLEILQALEAAYKNRYNDMAAAITEEMGAPKTLAIGDQAGAGLAHISAAIEVLKNYEFEQPLGTNRVVKEPIGVVALITPWNWPINQITAKVAPALAVGCTMVLKPSEVAPLSGYIFAEIVDEAGLPAGVFNMVNGDGAGVGSWLSKHPGVDMVSFTGSTRAGSLVAQNAAPTVKRVTQELGGKSPNIILDDADLDAAVTAGVLNMFSNTGQSCNAPSRMLVPAAKLARAEEIAREAAATVVVGDPGREDVDLGPLSSEVQFNKVQALIEKGIAEGARVVAGGPGRPEGLEKGYFVKPTVFSGVTNDMTIAREEIFGPVICMIPYESEEEAIAVANDTVYGLAAYVQGEPEHARQVASRLRAGMVTLNGNFAMDAPFGGYKQSGNGREWGEYGFGEYLETKAIVG